jgi:hypothetical protein
MHRVDARTGDVHYQVDGREVFTDTGRRLAFTAAGAADRAAIVTALGMARVKFGRKITLTGSDAFKEQAIQLMVEKRMDLVLVDPTLKARRQALIEERRRRPASARSAVFSPQSPPSLAPASSRMRRPARPSPEPAQAAPEPTPDALRAQDLAGIKAELAQRGITDLRPAKPGQRYEGKILVVTAYHVIQHAGRDQAIVHDRQTVPEGGLVAGQLVTLGQAVRPVDQVPTAKPRRPRPS